MRRGIGVREAALLGALAVLMVGGSIAATGRQVPPRRPLDVLGYALLAAAVAVLAARRRYPLPVLVASVLVAGGYLLVGYPYGPLFIATAVAMYAAAVRLPVWQTAVAFLATVLVVVAAQLGHGPPGDLTDLGVLVAAWAGWFLLPVWVGLTVRLWLGRRGEQQALRREEQRADDERLRRELTEERLRLSREVHDVVGHSLSVISMQAGAALHVFDRRPDAARDALLAIQDSSRHALGDLRRAVRAMREEGDGDADAVEPARAAPGLAEVADLVDRTVRAGVAVRLTETGTPPALPAEVQTAAYRIVQESLTNAVRHGHASAVRVRLSFVDDGMFVEVADDGCGAPAAGTGGPGNGIAGMRGRADELGGWLRAGPAPAGGFRVHAWLPAAH